MKYLAPSLHRADRSTGSTKVTQRREQNVRSQRNIIGLSAERLSLRFTLHARCANSNSLSVCPGLSSASSSSSSKI